MATKQRLAVCFKLFHTLDLTKKDIYLHPHFSLYVMADMSLSDLADRWNCTKTRFGRETW